MTPAPDPELGDAGQQPQATTKIQRAIRRSRAALALRIRTPDLLPYVILVVLVALISSQRSDYLSVGQLNLSSEVALSLVLVAAGQTFALLVGGFDLSVGGCGEWSWCSGGGGAPRLAKRGATGAHR